MHFVCGHIDGGETYTMITNHKCDLPRIDIPSNPSTQQCSQSSREAEPKTEISCFFEHLVARLLRMGRKPEAGEE